MWVTRCTHCTSHVHQSCASSDNLATAMNRSLCSCITSWLLGQHNPDSCPGDHVRAFLTKAMCIEQLGACQKHTVVLWYARAEQRKQPNSLNGERTVFTCCKQHARRTTAAANHHNKQLPAPCYTSECSLCLTYTMSPVYCCCSHIFERKAIQCHAACTRRCRF